MRCKPSHPLAIRQLTAAKRRFGSGATDLRYSREVRFTPGKRPNYCVVLSDATGQSRPKRIAAKGRLFDHLISNRHHSWRNVRPSCFAVLRLINRSSLLRRNTGISAGFSPLSKAALTRGGAREFFTAFLCEIFHTALARCLRWRETRRDPTPLNLDAGLFLQSGRIQTRICVHAAQKSKLSVDMAELLNLSHEKKLRPK
jgi:hypothetical protein